ASNEDITSRHRRTRAEDFRLSEDEEQRRAFLLITPEQELTFEQRVQRLELIAQEEAREEIQQRTTGTPRTRSRTRRTLDVATEFYPSDDERRTLTRTSSPLQQEDSQEQTSSPTTETVTQTQPSGTQSPPLSTSEPSETKRTETPILITSPSSPPPSDPMTTQQTSASLQNLISALRTLTNGEKKKENKVAVPNSYDGSPAKASTFLTEVDLYLMANETLYPDDKNKILFTLSYMKEGQAANWMKAKTDEYKKLLKEKEAEAPDTKPEDQIHVTTWEEFLEDFKKAFRPLDIGTDARLKMKLLKQNKKHVDEYIMEFRLLAADAEYDDRALIDHFLTGLHPALLKSCLMQPDQPNTIEEWYDRARKYNNAWLTMMAITGGERSKKTAKPETKVNWISDTEAQEYRRKGLCYKCSKPGHIAWNYQEKPNNEQRKEGAKKPSPQDAYHKIRAIYRDFSEEEQTQILDLMEGEGF
ncbi:hypothetical protein Moror_11356, partial [Moniliophthora roreri MCA 2997]